VHSSFEKNNLYSDQPLLSILIPAYQYPQGVRNIINKLNNSYINQCEIIIFDDSLDDEVWEIIKMENKNNSNYIKYQKNTPSKGAAKNWNALLEKASGEFCLLMHHDEFPVNSYLVKNLINYIKNKNQFDVLVMDCLIYDLNFDNERHHVPFWLKTFVIKYFPNYLFRRNVIGPTSSLLVRRTMFPKFDLNLRWLVDVELYVRLRNNTSLWIFSDKIQIGSLYGRSDSITAKLGLERKAVLDFERAYLAKLYPTASIWLSNETGYIIRFFETFVWLLLRIFCRKLYIFLFLLVSIIINLLII
jgi:glycosyltransferase involved in cell wall biosynthesis